MKGPGVWPTATSERFVTTNPSAWQRRRDVFLNLPCRDDGWIYRVVIHEPLSSIGQGLATPRQGSAEPPDRRRREACSRDDPTSAPIAARHDRRQRAESAAREDRGSLPWPQPAARSEPSNHVSGPPPPFRHRRLVICRQLSLVANGDVQAVPLADHAWTTHHICPSSAKPHEVHLCGRWPSASGNARRAAKLVPFPISMDGPFARESSIHPAGVRPRNTKLGRHERTKGGVETRRRLLAESSTTWRSVDWPSMQSAADTPPPPG